MFHVEHRASSQPCRSRCQVREFTSSLSCSLRTHLFTNPLATASDGRAGETATSAPRLQGWLRGRRFRSGGPLRIPLEGVTQPSSRCVPGLSYCLLFHVDRHCPQAAGGDLSSAALCNGLCRSRVVPRGTRYSRFCRSEHQVHKSLVTVTAIPQHLAKSTVPRGTPFSFAATGCRFLREYPGLPAKCSTWNIGTAAPVAAPPDLPATEAAPRDA